MKLCGVLASTVAALFLPGCNIAQVPTPDTLPYYADGSFTPHWYASRSGVPEGFHQIPAFTLFDQEGRTLTEKNFAGKLYIANFFFASCYGICPVTMANMARLEKTFGEDNDVLLLSHSVTPDTDTVPVLRAFAERMGATASKWHLVTGSREHIYDLGKQAYFADEDLGEAPPIEADSAFRDTSFLHTESFFLVDRDRRIRGVYNGMSAASVTQLVADVRKLQREAAP